MKHIWIWCSFNTVLIILSLMFQSINADLIRIQNERIDQIEDQVSVIQYYLDHKKDSVIVNVVNEMEIPKVINVKLK